MQCPSPKCKAEVPEVLFWGGTYYPAENLTHADENATFCCPVCLMEEQWEITKTDVPLKISHAEVPESCPDCGGKLEEIQFGLEIGANANLDVCSITTVCPHCGHDIDIPLTVEPFQVTASPPVRCRVCGCSDHNPCVLGEEEETHTCHWSEPDLCSACVGQEA